MLVKKLYKKIKYPFVSYCIIFGIVLAYCSFYYALGFSKKLYFEEKEINEFKNYKYSFAFQVFSSESLESMSTFLRSGKAVASFNEVSMYIDDCDILHMCKVYINYNDEGYPYKLVSGFIPDTNVKYSENLVVLGIKNKKYTRTINGEDYINLCGDVYRVAGYVTTEKSEICDNSIILFANAMGDNSIRELETQISSNRWIGLVLLLQSNSTDIEKWIKDNNEFYDIFSISGIAKEYFEFGSGIVNKGHVKYAYLLYIFSLVIVVMVIRLWIIERKKEFVIRRICGYRRTKLIGLLVGELFKILSATSIILLVLQRFLIYLSYGIRDYDVEMTDVLLMLVFFVITFVVAVSYPIYHILKNDIYGNSDYIL